MTIFDRDKITVNGRRFLVTFPHDADMGPPWKEHDGHGPVSDWTTRDKKPGELVLSSDGRGRARNGSRRFYDFAEAMKIAKRDGWDAKPYKTGTRNETALRAVMADFKHLQDWCNDVWSWVGVVVQEVDEDGDTFGPTESLWGIEGGEGDYLEETARELIDNLLDDQERAFVALAATLGVALPIHHAASA